MSHSGCEQAVGVTYFECVFVNLGVLNAMRNIFNPLNAELNPIGRLLALLGAHPILHVSKIRVKHSLINGTIFGKKRY